ncbi:unnamed protein product [Closterium sp. NIES-54]
MATIMVVAAARGGQRRPLPLPDDPTPLQLREWRCVTGSVKAAALGASASTAALGASKSAGPLGASESAAALGARASPATGPSSADALHTYTLYSGASRCFFRDCTTLTPLPALVPVSLADPTRGPVVARASTVLPCPAVPSGSLSSLHFPTFSTNLVSRAAIQDVWINTFIPRGQRVAICMCSRTGRHLATFTRRLGSSLYTLTTASPQTLLRHHRLDHPSLPCLRGMHYRLLVSSLPRSLPSLPRLPAPPCLPCVKGRQRAAPHSSEFSPTTAPLQTLHMDVWGPAPVSGTDRERYFLLVVDDYTHYTTVFPLRRKVDVSGVLIPWIRATRCQLCERLSRDCPVLRLHSGRGGKFSSNLLAEFCRDEGIHQSFALPTSPQRNGIAERRIGLIMEVARTSMIHAAAPHFLWPFAVRYAPHQLNLWLRGPAPSGVSQVDPPPLVEPLKISFDSFGPAEPGAVDSRAETTGAEPGGAETEGAGSGGAATGGAATGGAGSGGATTGGAGSWGAATGGPDSRGTASAGGNGGTARGAGGAAGAGGPGATSPRGATSFGGAGPTSPGDTAGAGGAGGATGAGGAGARGTGGAGAVGPKGARTRGAGAAGAGGAVRAGGATGAAGNGGAGGIADAGGTGAGGTGVTGGAGAAGPGGARTRGAGAAGAGGTASAGGIGAGGTGGAGAAGPGGACTRGVGAAEAGGAAGAGGAGGATRAAGTGGAGGTAGSGGARARGTGGSGGAGGAGAGGAGAASAGGARAAGSAPRQLFFYLLVLPHLFCARGVARPRPPAVPGTHCMALRPSSVPQRVVLPEPPASSLPHVLDPMFDLARAASPTVTCLLATVVTDPDLESNEAFALVIELVDFAARSRLDYVASLVTESESVCPSSVGGEPALSSDVLEDRQFELECLAAALHRFTSMLLCPEGDPDALDIPTPRSYAEAIAVDGMWIFIVKWPSGSPPTFEARYVARGFSQRQGVDYFHTFSPTPKMTTLRVLLHVAAQRDYELHSLDFSTAFLQGSLHEEIWLRRPPGFTGTTIAALGFAPSSADPSLFLRTDTTLSPFYVLVYVDDLVFATTDTEALALVLQRFGFQFSSLQPTPLSTGHSLSAPPSDESVEPSGLYLELVGCLMYLMTCTRHDLACEAEIFARAMAAQELRWLTYVRTDLGERPRSPPVLYVDNKAMLALSHEQILEHKTKHIALRYFLARELQ